MPKVLWLLEHVHLRVDPLKDAAGSPFGKADRLYVSVPACSEVVCGVGEHQNRWHIDVNDVKISTHI